MRVVALSLACNNACVFCAQGKLRAAEDTADAEAAVRRAASDLVKGETVALVGGEPTLDERLPDFVRALDAAGAGRVVVQTNGRRLAYRAYARALREASDRLALDVSLAGSTEAMHDYHTGTPGSFKQTVLGLRNARAEGVPASVSCVVTRSNFRHLSEIVRLCRAVPVSGLRFVLARPLGTARELAARVVPAPELAGPYLAMALAEAQKCGLAARADAAAEPYEGAEGAFAGLGPAEAEAATDARVAGAAAEKAAADERGRRSLAMFGRPAPARREERSHARKTGDELRAILPALFEGAAPREVADVVAADKPVSSRQPAAAPRQEGTG